MILISRGGENKMLEITQAYWENIMGLPRWTDEGGGVFVVRALLLADKVSLNACSYEKR